MDDLKINVGNPDGLHRLRVKYVGTRTMRSVLPGKMPYVRPKQRFVGMVKEDVVGWCE